MIMRAGLVCLLGPPLAGDILNAYISDLYNLRFGWEGPEATDQCDKQMGE